MRSLRFSYLHGSHGGFNAKNCKSRGDLCGWRGTAVSLRRGADENACRQSFDLHSKNAYAAAIIIEIDLGLRGQKAARMFRNQRHDGAAYVGL